MDYSLPKSVEIDGIEYEIRSDYRAILDICVALSDNDLDDEGRAIVALNIFYPKLEEMDPRNYQKALEKCCDFIALNQRSDGKTGKKKNPKLIDWDQDFFLMISPINKVAGCEIRALEYLHWWTFIGYYNEIDGECTFSHVVKIRDSLAKGRKLSDSDRKWYQNNHEIVDFKNKYSSNETDLIEEWINGKRDTDPDRD